MKNKHIWISVALIAVFALIGYFFLRPSASKHFQFGLDLVGGTELVYKADTSKVADPDSAMESLKDVIERRVNVFGVSEPIVQVEKAGVLSGNAENRLIVDLPGYKDAEEAKNALGQTPLLEFDLVQPGASSTDEATLVPTGLTGRYLSHAQIAFDSSTQAPLVTLDFNSEGKDLFAKITSEHKGEQLAIVLDNQVLETPVIQEEIRDGSAQITGGFTPDGAKELVRNLNYGALPVPISLLSSQTIGATLGEAALNSGVKAGIVGFGILVLFMILWYRLPGFVASVALVSYVIVSLAIFKLISITLSAAGIAGFILSIGMAVDANILIFERTKEELAHGRDIQDSLHEGFHRAWLSIRDSNISSIITAIILFWLGTSAVKGFALTLGIGVLVSMLTAISVSRTFLFAIAPKSDSAFKRFIFSNGFSAGKPNTK